MNFDEYRAKESLEQLISTWKYLTPFQRFQVRAYATIITIPSRIKKRILYIYYAFPNWVNSLRTRTYPAHWL